jgi:hypothetical protein
MKTTMKTKQFFLFTVSIAVALFSFSCSEDDDSDSDTKGKDTEVAVTGIRLDKTTLSIVAESIGQLEATLEPAGVAGTIEWSSQNQAIAAVNNKGVVTGLSAGTTKIAATCGAFTAFCEVTVTSKPVDLGEHPSLEGSDYFVIVLSENAFDAVKDKVIHDFRPDDVNKFLYVWNAGETLDAGNPSGLNFYGEDGWVSFIVTNAGWSGAGYAISPGFGTINMTPFFNNPDDYCFHIALKSAQPTSSYTFTFTDKVSTVVVVIGSAAVDGKTPYTDFARDNEWHEIEIPMSYFASQGLYFREPFQDVNIFSFSAGGVAGTTLDMDAVFFYKKKKAE